MNIIPKKIHYCWFGKNKLPEQLRVYIESWKKYCPDYEIIEWNESNFDVNQNKYCQEAYEAKKWAFVSDYVRLKVLYDYGGIYMDTDVEVCKPLDDFLNNDYEAFSGFENGNRIPTGIMASIKGGSWIKYLLSYYDDKRFKNIDGSYDMTPNVVIITEMTERKFKVNLSNEFIMFGNNVAIYPFDYFCAKSTVTGKILKTNNTYTIHHFSGSWLTNKQKIKQKLINFIIRYFGNNTLNTMLKIKNLYKE